MTRSAKLKKQDNKGLCYSSLWQSLSSILLFLKIASLFLLVFFSFLLCTDCQFYPLRIISKNKMRKKHIKVSIFGS